jgi:hypothetical protein
MVEAGHAGDNGVDGSVTEGVMLAGIVEWSCGEHNGHIADSSYQKMVRWVAA